MALPAFDDSHLAACPGCGRRNLLAQGIIMVQVALSPNRVGPPYGTPGIGFIPENAIVECNFITCKWEGSWDEVMAAQND